MLDFAMMAATVAGAVAEHHEEPSALGFGPGAWVALSMLAVFGVMVYAKVPAIVAGMLDKQIAGIREQLDAASTLRKDAEALKAEYEAKTRTAASEVEAMKAAAQVEAKDIVAKAKADATALIERRAKSAEDKIGAAERAAIADVRARAAAAATSAATVLIAAVHDAKADKALVDGAISQLN
jgi:F-type H+-transporting ATPase subunit b